MTPAEYLNAAKAALHVQTDYALAKALDVPKQQISFYYKGTRTPDDETVAKLALALDLPVGEVLADIRAQTARTDKARGFWRDFLSRTKQAAVIALLWICGATCCNVPGHPLGATGAFKRVRGWS